MTDMNESQDGPGVQALAASGLAHTLRRHGPVKSLTEAAAARGVAPQDMVKTMLVRRGKGDYLFVLVPGLRTISWPKLRAVLGVSRLSMPDADQAHHVTGYLRGAITPFGSAQTLPVIADVTLTGRMVSIGAGEHGVAATVDADQLVHHLQAQVVDVTEPE
ncbi:aminoacyl-tRNA deacylase [Pseudactinotalea sp. Z1732]|uniref:aminoacyl-tRNA deacylase n=1 Tax=Pseudactinotalea sp. Z1732 TaxID=3413026 RepID=UPI003C7B4CEE